MLTKITKQIVAIRLRSGHGHCWDEQGGMPSGHCY